MELNNKAGDRAGSIDAETASSVAGETDLYGELMAFLALSPDRQRRQSDRTDKPSPPVAAEHAHPKPVATTTPLREQVEATIVEPKAESASVYEDSEEPSELSNAVPPIFEGASPSGSLAGLSPDFPFTGALSRGVCIACGAESGADDLFCITCGAFIDEVSSTLTFNPTCTVCGLGIAADEIFCPRCGSVLPPAVIARRGESL